MLAIAIANGALRQAAFVPLFGELAAHQISSAMLIVLYLFYFRHLKWKFGLRSAGEAWRVGAMWLVLTVGFEFGVGHFVFGSPWSTLLYDYNLSEGRVWPLVLVAIAMGPVLFYYFGRPGPAER